MHHAHSNAHTMKPQDTSLSHASWHHTQAHAHIPTSAHVEQWQSRCCNCAITQPMYASPMPAHANLCTHEHMGHPLLHTQTCQAARNPDAQTHTNNACMHMHVPTCRHICTTHPRTHLVPSHHKRMDAPAHAPAHAHTWLCIPSPITQYLDTASCPHVPALACAHMYPHIYASAPCTHTSTWFPAAANVWMCLLTHPLAHAPTPMDLTIG